jgi:hypothetical protein
MEVRLLPDIHSYTNQCNPQVIEDYIIEDLVVLNQNNVDTMAYRKNYYS